MHLVPVGSGSSRLELDSKLATGVLDNTLRKHPKSMRRLVDSMASPTVQLRLKAMETPPLRATLIRLAGAIQETHDERDKRDGTPGSFHEIIDSS